jgi:hypothetical protein
MQRGYKRKRRGSRRAFKLIAVALSILMLALVWVWKSNQVKDFYARMKKVETERKDLVAENMRLRGTLLDLKSLSAMGKFAREFGLTQNVSRRIFLSDPVQQEKKPGKFDFANETEVVPDWLDNAISGSGRVRAESDKGNY